MLKWKMLLKMEKGGYILTSEKCVLTSEDIIENVFIECRKFLLQGSLRELIIYHDEMIKKQGTQATQLYVDEFSIIKTKTLNTLEYFALNFCTEIADEETVYQSLHQVYRSTVIMFYYDISIYNKAVADKYYTNIIALFHKWNKKYCASAKAEKEFEDQTKKIQNENAAKEKRESERNIKESRKKIIKPTLPYHQKKKKK